MRVFASVGHTILACLSFYTGCLELGATSSWSTPPVFVSGFNALQPVVARNLSKHAVAVWQIDSEGPGQAIQAATLLLNGTTWSAPVTLSDPTFNSFGPQVAVDKNGNAVAVWRHDVDGSLTNFRIQASYLPFGGSWTPAVYISPADQVAVDPQVNFDSLGNAVAVWGYNDGVNAFLGTSTLPAAGASWTPIETISDPAFSVRRPQITFDSNNRAIVVWEWSAGFFLPNIIQSATRPLNKAWTPFVNVSNPLNDAFDPQIAADKFGNAVTVWDEFDDDNLTNTIKGAKLIDSIGWTAPAQISVSGIFFGPYADTPQVAVDNEGNALAVWRQTDDLEQHIRSAFLPFGSPNWSLNPNSLSVLGSDAGEPQVAFEKSGIATIVWHLEEEVVQYSFRYPNGAYSTPQNLSISGSNHLATIAINSVGDKVVTWLNIDNPLNSAIGRVQSVVWNTGSAQSFHGKMKRKYDLDHDKNFRLATSWKTPLWNVNEIKYYKIYQGDKVIKKVRHKRHHLHFTKNVCSSDHLKSRYKIAPVFNDGSEGSALHLKIVEKKR